MLLNSSLKTEKIIPEIRKSVNMISMYQKGVRGHSLSPATEGNGVEGKTGVAGGYKPSSTGMYSATHSVLDVLHHHSQHPNMHSKPRHHPNMHSKTQPSIQNSEETNVVPIFKTGFRSH